MAMPKSVPWRVAAFLLMMPLLLSFVVLAQEPPRIELDEGSLAVGEPAALRASGLEAEAEYLLAIEGPAEQTLEETLEADAEGMLRFRFEPTTAGEWLVRLSGQDVNLALTMEVAEAQGAEPEPADAEPADAEPGDAEPGDAEPADAEAGHAEPAGEPESDASEEEIEPAESRSEEAGGEESPVPTGGAEPAPAARPEEAVTVTTDGDAVIGRRGDRRVWRFDFPGGSGGTGAVLEAEDRVWVGHGNSVLVIDRESGRALARYPMPGKVLRLETTGDDVSAVSDVGGNLRQRIEIDEGGPNSVVRFGVDPEPFGWLRREAEVPDPLERLERDPTNPWLHLRAGLETREGPNRRRSLERAVETGGTFYDLAGIARALYQAGEQELARDAMNRALQDFAERGYDPRLLTSAELHRAYDFPLAGMERALAESDMGAAGFWAPWLYLVSSEEAPETRRALGAYADRLAEAGRRDAALLWRERAQEGRSASPAASLDRLFLGLGRSGWYGVGALLVAILALHLTLLAKYWAPQSLAIRRGRETGGGRKPWARLLAIRYYSFTEKLVLVLLFAACLTLLGLTHWYDAPGERPVTLGSGTLASPVARDVVTSSSLEGARGAFIRGYAAQTAGERRAAQEEYLAAGDFPKALNNLGALLEDDVLYRRALEMAPGMPAASYNLGRSTDPSPFHHAYQSQQPLLAAPSSGDFRTAVAGSWQRAIGSTFENPWRALRGMPFFGLPKLVWQVLLALFLLWALVTMIWLLVPRPALARNAPRTPVYHLLALLIPGSGLADEAWGVLLMIPWALVGVDALAQWLGWPRSLGLPLETELWILAAIYLVNLIAFVVEFVSYRRRMRNLRRRHPEAIEAYGMHSA